MKKLSQIMIIYVIAVGLLVTFSYKVIDKDSRSLQTTLLQIDGAEYLKNLYGLSVLISNSMNKTPRYAKSHNYGSKRNLVKQIENVMALQKKNSEFVNREFNSKLELIKTFQMTKEDLYSFLESFNHENYVIGDKSKLLFEEGRELFFLSTLVTHYSPEFFISLITTHNIVEDFKYEKTLSEKNRVKFTQDFKLVCLSVEEIASITNLLSQYENAKDLKSYVASIQRKIEIAQTLPLSALDFNQENIDRRIKNAHETLNLTHKLIRETFRLIEEGLQARRDRLSSEIFQNTLIFFFIFLAFSVLTGLYYRAYLLNYEKDAEIKKISATLDKFVVFCKTDKNGFITYASSALETLSGYSQRELIGENPRLFKHKETSLQTYKEMWRVITAKKIYSGKLLNRTKFGDTYWAEIIIIPELDEDEEIIAFSAYIIDVTDQKALEKKTDELLIANQKLESMAIIDALTRVYNRLKLDIIMKRAYESYRRYKKIFSIIIIDIDHFKEVNDAHGHLVGDEVLKGMVKIMKSRVRHTDLLGRWGGEEFMIICEETDALGAYHLSEKIRKALESHKFEKAGVKTVSCGVAEIEEGLSINDFIKRADDALYEAKKSGRNRTIIHENRED